MSRQMVDPLTVLHLDSQLQNDVTQIWTIVYPLPSVTKFLNPPTPSLRDSIYVTSFLSISCLSNSEHWSHQD